MTPRRTVRDPLPEIRRFDTDNPPPPKGDPVFELKPLHDNLKYAYLDEKKIYHVISLCSLCLLTSRLESRGKILV